MSTIERFRRPAVLFLMAVFLGAGAPAPAVAAPAQVKVTRCNEQAFRGAVAAAPAEATIRFLCDGAITLTQAGGGTIEVGSDVAARDLTIDGGGRRVTLSGGGQIRMFVVNKGSGLTLRGLTLRDGRVAEDGLFGGGAVLSLGALTVDKTTFRDNVSRRRGGAIDVYRIADRLVVTNSRFEGNRATCELVHPSGGGAIAILQGAPTTIRSSVFTRNSAVGTGCLGGAIGGLRETFTLPGPLQVVDSTFTDNSAEGLGVVALWALDLFPGGGALASLDRDLSIERSVFTDNRVDATHDVRGGAVYAASTRRGWVFPATALAIRDVRIERNRILTPPDIFNIGSGGGVAMVGNYAPAVIDKALIAGNSSPFAGGLDASVDGATVHHSAIVDNVAQEGQGGGIRVSGTTTISKSRLAGNRPGNCALALDGTIVDGGQNRELDAGKTCFGLTP